MRITSSVARLSLIVKETLGGRGGGGGFQYQWILHLRHGRYTALRDDEELVVRLHPRLTIIPFVRLNLRGEWLGDLDASSLLPPSFVSWNIVGLD